jgi:hypothetical protein
VVQPGAGSGLARTESGRPVRAGRRKPGPRAQSPRWAPDATPDRVAVARLLAGKGPLAGNDSAAALGWSLERWWAAVWQTERWFQVTGKGYVLTPAGRREALGEGAG